MVKTMRFFDPAWYRNDIVEVFQVCPGILRLFNYGREDVHSKVVCITAKNEERVYYIPKQQVCFLRCGQDEYIGNRYVIAHVCSKQGGEPDFWLVVCSFGGHGYLLPIDAFTEAGDDRRCIDQASFTTGAHVCA